MSTATIINGDARRLPLADCSVHCCICSPPYFGLRDYGTASWEGGSEGCDHQPPNDAPNGNKGQPQVHAGRHSGDCGKCGARRVDRQIGLEVTPSEFVDAIVRVFREVKRVLRDDGCLWLNLGDSYCSNPAGNLKPRSEHGNGEGRFRLGGDKQAETLELGKVKTNTLNLPGLKPKDLIGIPWRVALALQDDGWYLRSDIIWSKPNPMPESVTDRPTKSHEYVFLLTKSERYYWDQEAVREGSISAGRIPGGNRKVDSSRNDAGRDMTIPVAEGRNIRSVWKSEAEYIIGVDDGGMSRITSPDCPVHGCPASPAPAPRDDGRRDVSQPDRNRRNDVDPLPGQVAFAFSTPEDPSGSLSDSVSAKLRSTRIRRTATESGPDVTCDDRQVFRIECTGLPTRFDAKSGHTPGSSTSADASSDGPDFGLSGQTPVRSEDNSACLPTPLRCTCNYMPSDDKDNTSSRYFPSVWVISTEPFKGSHFGTYPPALVERCVKAGTSEKGCCPGCGAPWERVVESHGYSKADRPSARKCAGENPHNQGSAMRCVGGGNWPRSTLGWRQSCSCPAHDPIPCTVLDNFAGSGTTGVVATGLNRRFVGVDLSPDYCRMAVRRISRPHASHRTPRKAESHPLFAGMDE